MMACGGGCRRAGMKKGDIHSRVRGCLLLRGWTTNPSNLALYCNLLILIDILVYIIIIDY